MAHAGMNLNLINIAFYILFLSSLTICIFASPTIKREAGIEIVSPPLSDTMSTHTHTGYHRASTPKMNSTPSLIKRKDSPEKLKTATTTQAVYATVSPLSPSTKTIRHTYTNQTSSSLLKKSSPCT